MIFREPLGILGLGGLQERRLIVNRGVPDGLVCSTSETVPSYGKGVLDAPRPMLVPWFSETVRGGSSEIIGMEQDGL